MTPDTEPSGHPGTYISFATAEAVPLADVDRSLKAHFALEWPETTPARLSKNAMALWSGEGTVLTRFIVGTRTLLIETDRGSGETHVRLADEPALLA